MLDAEPGCVAPSAGPAPGDREGAPRSPPRRREGSCFMRVEGRPAGAGPAGSRSEPEAGTRLVAAALVIVAALAWAAVVLPALGTTDGLGAWGWWGDHWRAQPAAP